MSLPLGVPVSWRGSSHSPTCPLRFSSHASPQRASLVTSALPSLRSLWTQKQQRDPGLQAARQTVLQEVASSSPNRQALDAAVDTLVSGRVPFRENLLGGGPWQVVYTRGPLLWKQWTAAGKLAGSDNKASQAFEPRGRTVLNRGEIAGERFFVTARGTYEPLDDSPRCPKRIKASIEQGALHLLQWTLPLPIKGSGLVDVAYLDETMRIFQSPAGSLTLQVRQDRL